MRRGLDQRGWPGALRHGSRLGPTRPPPALQLPVLRQAALRPGRFGGSVRLLPRRHRRLRSARASRLPRRGLTDDALAAVAGASGVGLGSCGLYGPDSGGDTMGGFALVELVALIPVSVFVTRWLVHRLDHSR